MEQEKPLIAYKSFSKDLTCYADFQYKIGGQYKAEGVIELCDNGFHACENPLDVLHYVDDFTNRRYCLVEQSGEIIKGEDKQVSSEIKIVREISLEMLCLIGIERGLINSKRVLAESNNDSIDDIFSTLDHDVVAPMSSHMAHIAGRSSSLIAERNTARLISSGAFNKICSLGDNQVITSVGHKSCVLSYTRFCDITSTGYYNQIFSMGDCTRLSSLSHKAFIYSSGENASIMSSGDNAIIYSEGKNANIYCAGRWPIVRAKKGSTITLTEFHFTGPWGLIAGDVKTEKVDGERIKEDTWYTLSNGKFKKVTDYFALIHSLAR